MDQQPLARPDAARMKPTGETADRVPELGVGPGAPRRVERLPDQEGVGAAERRLRVDQRADVAAFEAAQRLGSLAGRQPAHPGACAIGSAARKASSSACGEPVPKT